MKRKAFKVFLVFALLLVTVSASVPNMALAGTNDIKVIVNDKVISMDEKPFIENSTGRTFVPIRFVAEALNATVDYEATTKKITITKGSKVIQIFVGKKDTIVNGKKGTSDTAPVIKNGRTFVPLRFVAENLDCTVDWDSQSRVITIKEKDFVPNTEKPVTNFDDLGLTKQPLSTLGEPIMAEFALREHEIYYAKLGLPLPEEYKQVGVIYISKEQLPIKFSDGFILYDIQEDGEFVTTKTTMTTKNRDNDPPIIYLWEKGVGNRTNTPIRKSYDGNICIGTYSVKQSWGNKYGRTLDFKNIDYVMIRADFDYYVAIKNPWK